MAQVSVDMSGDNARLNRALARSDAKVQKLEASLKNTGRAGQKAGKQLKKAADPKPFDGMIKKLAGAGGVVAALGLVNKANETWLANIREVAKEASKASGEIIALAALQEEGSKGTVVRQAFKLGARFGVLDRGLVVTAFQGLQSAHEGKGGDAAALAALRTVFAGRLAGVPVDVGLAAESLGASLGLPVGQTERSLFVAGELSSKDPSVLTNAAFAIKFFADKALGFGALSVLAESVKPGELGTFGRVAGIALSSQSAEEFQEFRQEKLKLPKNATQEEVLRALAKAGIDTPEELGDAGLTEQRQVEALVTLVSNVDQVLARRDEILKKARPGLFQHKRQGIEDDPELGIVKLHRHSEILEAEAKNLQAIGPIAEKAMRFELDTRIEGLARRRIGDETALGVFDNIDETGRAKQDFFGNIARRIEGFALSTFEEAKDFVGGFSDMFDLRTVRQPGEFNSRPLSDPFLDTFLGRRRPGPTQLEIEEGKIREELKAIDREQAEAAAGYVEASRMISDASVKLVGAAEKIERAAGGGTAMAPVNDDQGGP